MDIFCDQCGEPWDHNHVLDVLPCITRLGGLSDEDLEKPVKDQEGQWWRFVALYRHQFFEANYLILQCPACEPRVGHPECKHCFGSGRVFVKRATHADRPECRKYFYGFDPNIRPAPQPFRMAAPYQHDREGMVYRGWARCPECFATDKEYWAAMTEVGWKEPGR